MRIVFVVWHITPENIQDGREDEHPHEHEQEEDPDVIEALFNQENKEAEVLHKSQVIQKLHDCNGDQEYVDED